MLTLDGSWRAENAPELSSKYLMVRIWKIKQFLNYINGWYKSKYSSSPKIILKSEKKIKKNEKLCTGDNFQSCNTGFLSKIPNRKKISNKDFNISEEETSLDEIIKSINSQTSNKSPGKDGIRAVFYKLFSNELAPVL